MAYFSAGSINNIRLWSSYEFNENNELELGFSGIWTKGNQYKVQTDNLCIYGLDTTYKCITDTYSRWFWQSEVLWLKRELGSDQINHYGVYSYFGYRIDKYWELGCRGDYTQSAGISNSSIKEISVVVTNHERGVK